MSRLPNMSEGGRQISGELGFSECADVSVREVLISLQGVGSQGCNLYLLPFKEQVGDSPEVQHLAASHCFVWAPAFLASRPPFLSPPPGGDCQSQGHLLLTHTGGSPLPQGKAHTPMARHLLEHSFLPDQLDLAPLFFHVHLGIPTSAFLGKPPSPHFPSCPFFFPFHRSLLEREAPRGRAWSCHAKTAQMGARLLTF